MQVLTGAGLGDAGRDREAAAARMRGEGGRRGGGVSAGREGRRARSVCDRKGLTADRRGIGDECPAAGAACLHSSVGCLEQEPADEHADWDRCL